MKHMKNRLGKQLIWLIGFAFVLLFISLGLVLPTVILPVAEKNIYSYLKEPLKLVNANVDYKLLDTEVAYLYVVGDQVIVTDNLKDVIAIDDYDKLLNYMNRDYGKFFYNHKTYYYYMLNYNNGYKIALTNDSYINKTKSEILETIFPIVLLTCLTIGFLLVSWSSLIVKKIEKLKNKIDNIDNPDYNHIVDFKIDDEIKSLDLAIEDMRLSLINQEEYRNQMYQNISHDFKTPLTVIKSYIEAVEDEVEDKDTALAVIKEQTSKLEQKVHSLLYLNKLDYLKTQKKIELVPVDIANIINTEVEKFKFHRKELKFVVEIDKKATFVGTVDNWETIFDNLLGNFIRYANKTIKITVTKNKIVLYNDGDNIDEDFLEGIFTPFRKGIKGEFGLGLSIVKKTLNIMGYDIEIVNEKKGVSFIITKGIHK